MHCACCVEIAILLMLLSAHVTSVLFLVQFNNFVLTMGFFWSYTLLLKSPVLMCSWHAYQWHSHVTRLDVGMSGNRPALCWAIQPTVLFTYTTQLVQCIQPQCRLVTAALNSKALPSIYTLVIETTLTDLHTVCVLCAIWS